MVSKGFPHPSCITVYLPCKLFPGVFHNHLLLVAIFISTPTSIEGAFFVQVRLEGKSCKFADDVASWIHYKPFYPIEFQKDHSYSKKRKLYYRFVVICCISLLRVFNN